MTPYKRAFTPSVATMELSFVLVTRKPLTNPVIIAAPNAAATAGSRRSSLRSGPHVTMTTVNETAPATERSMPPC